LDPDDELDSGYTDANGQFQLAGDEREMTNIDPQLKIYHSCNKGLNVIAKNLPLKLFLQAIVFYI
jgi:hypothetical protein